MIYPVLALVLLTFVVAIMLGSSRVIAAKTGKVDLAYYRLFRDGVAPDFLEKLSRNYSNLLEAPVLFYLFAVLYLVLGLHSPVMLALSWLYVLLRLVHSMIHISYNQPLHRFFAFLASMLTLFALWVLLALDVTTL